jgi:hypothetical protein
VKVTLPEIMHGVSRLLEIYARPRHLPEDVEAIAKIWHRELGDLDADVFRAGISAYCRTDAEYFPKPGVVRKLGEAVARPAAASGGPQADYDRWERDWPEAPLAHPIPCPVCGGLDTWSNGGSFALRRGVLHDEAKHLAAGIPFIDWLGQHRLPLAAAKAAP